MILVPNEVYENIVKSGIPEVAALFTCPNNISEGASRGIRTIMEKIRDIDIDSQKI